MTEQQVKQKLIDIGAWDAFVRNYMDEFNTKDDYVNTTEKYIASELKNGFTAIIEGAFAWDCTPEGGYYWYKISNEKIDDNIEKNFDPKDGDIVSWDSEGDFGDEVEHCVAIVRGDNGWTNTTFHPEINIYAILNPDGVIFFSKSVTSYPFNFRLADDSDIKKLLSGLKKEGKMWNNELKQIDELMQNSENQEESRNNVQICYKTNEPCKHDCGGLCKESY